MVRGMIVSLNEEQLRKIIRDEVSEGINNALTNFGFRVDRPTEMQADLQYVRKSRLGSEAIKGNITKILLTVLIPTFLWHSWEYLKYIAVTIKMGTGK
jgi:hypothetical protein